MQFDIHLFINRSHLGVSNSYLYLLLRIASGAKYVQDLKLISLNFLVASVFSGVVHYLYPEYITPGVGIYPDRSAAWCHLVQLALW